jgi:hypothetical protein
MITAHPDTIRAMSEAQLAAQSNAAAREMGWFAINWQTLATSGKLQEQARAARKPATMSVREAIYDLIGDDWMALSDIIALHQRAHPDRSPDSVAGACRSLLHDKRVERKHRQNASGVVRKSWYRRAQA